jgi:hypothetical protein
MKIFCQNKDCRFYKALLEPEQFKFSQIYVPFEDDKCHGECAVKEYAFASFDESVNDFRYEGSFCLSAYEDKIGNLSSFCDNVKCASNENKKCTRSEILVDEVKTREHWHWACKCYSLPKIRGHIDFSSLLQPNGTAKGGSIDDEYANKMHVDKNKTKSFRTHMRQKP